MVTYYQAQENTGDRQLYLDELVQGLKEKQEFPIYVGNIIFMPDKNQFFGYLKTLFPEEEDAELMLMTRQNMNSAFNVLYNRNDYATKKPTIICVHPVAFKLSEPEFMSPLFDHEFKHCLMQYYGITFPSLSLNLSPLKSVYIGETGFYFIDELLSYSNEYTGLERWGLNTQEKQEEILSLMTRAITRLRESNNDLPNFIIPTATEITSLFLYDLQRMIPELFKKEEQFVQPKKRFSLRQLFR